jgi:hypothetical protein
MIRFLLLALVIASAATPAFAEPPTGFADFKWGTSPAAIRQQFIPSRCGSSTENRRHWLSIECHGYRVEGLTIPVLTFDFEPAESLAGYNMLVARGSYRALRDLMLQRFGRPTSRRLAPFASGQMSWTWPGVSATLTERCGEDYSCVEVRTSAIDRKREEIRERERRDSAQSF